MCSSKLPMQMSEGGDEEEEHPPSAVGTRCPREFKELFPTTFRTVSSAQYVHFLYWFCSDCPRGQMQKEVGLKTKTFAKLFEALSPSCGCRSAKPWVARNWKDLVASWPWTKLSLSEKNFRGRQTAGNKVVVMEFLEGLGNQKGNGNCALVQIPDRKAATLKARIQEFVAEGSLIFTDKLKSYQ